MLQNIITYKRFTEQTFENKLLYKLVETRTNIFEIPHGIRKKEANGRKFQTSGEKLFL